MTPIKNEDDFYWYKNLIDSQVKYHYKHIGLPERYPCKVTSRSEYYDNGPDIMYHDFVYQITVKCDHCGHEKLVWAFE